MSTTIATASKCPRCSQQGKLVRKGRNKVNPDYEDRVYQCQYKLCRWFESNWIVQVDEDGKVPERDIGHIDKAFPNLPELSPEAEKRLQAPKYDDDIALHQPS